MLPKPVVVEEHDRELDALLHGGDQLLRHHQIRAVADDHVDLALRRGHAHAQPAGNLVAHARVAVFEVVALRIARAPQLVQVAGQAAGGADDDVARPERRVEQRRCTSRLAERRRRPARATTRSTSASHAAVELADAPRCSRRGTRYPASARRELLERARASPTSGSARCLPASSSATLMATKRDVRVLERRLRRRREVAEARADDDDDIGLARQPVRGERARAPIAPS